MEGYETSLEFGDNSIVHMLTGWLPEVVPLHPTISPDIWNMLKQFLPEFKLPPPPPPAPPAGEQSQNSNESAAAAGPEAQAAPPPVAGPKPPEPKKPEPARGKADKGDKAGGKGETKGLFLFSFFWFYTLVTT